MIAEEFIEQIKNEAEQQRKELAEKIGMSTSTITYYMNKTILPRKKLWTYLANRISEAWPEYKAKDIYDILVEDARRRV